jgi:hypothetical protein
VLQRFSYRVSLTCRVIVGFEVFSASLVQLRLESDMWRCKAPTDDGSANIGRGSDLPPPRGLELIKLSARLYANGAESSNSILQHSCLAPGTRNKSTTKRVVSLAINGLRAYAIALFLFVLPGLGLAAIVCVGINSRYAGAERAHGDGNALSTRSASSALNSSSNVEKRSPPQAGRIAITIHKVKTERIDGYPAR